MFDEKSISQQLKEYLDLGLSPIPLKGKVAAYHWKEFKLTEANMKQYLRPGINWGLRTGLLPSGGYFYVIDLDSKSGLGDFYEKITLPPGTPIVSTGRGFHIYLRWRSPVKTMHFPGLDLIANGYVVAPPSIHASGKPYRFIVPLKSYIPELDPQECGLPNSPPPIIVDSLAPRLQGKAPADGKFILSGVPEGQRHNALVKYIGILLSSCFREEETLAEVASWNQSNMPPLPITEVVKTVRDCYERWDRYENPKRGGERYGR
jgi:hypothetical protein